jgi:hypothetical protein
MNVLRFQKFATQVAASTAPKLRNVRTRFLDVVDALAEARMQKGSRRDSTRADSSSTIDRSRIESSSAQR